ncbi:MAG: serine--tRNA ligase [Patescibacteria group bacterium]
MLDINFIRENLEKVKKAVKDKKLEVDLDKLLKLDGERRKLTTDVDELRAKKNEAAKKKDIEAGKKIKSELNELEKKLHEVEKQWQDLMYQIPNVPVEGVPEGDASNNKILRKEGEPTKFEFTPKDHVELGEILDIIDIPRAAKVSGTRFGYLKNEGVLLEFALVQLAIETLRKEKFIPIIPPALLKKEITDGLGYWHGKIDDEHTANENYYYLPTDNLYLIGTGEHVIVSMHSDEVLDEKELPKKYVAFSPCFRREAGSYGQDTKGIFRVHQFDKVEMVAFVKPEDDETERGKMLSIAEDLMKRLGLPYQVVQLASGDLSFPGAETKDIETWIPSQGKFRETHSISTTTDFQARRLNIKYEIPPVFSNGSIASQPLKGYVHILNGTCFAIGRMIIAILENFQREDGSVKIPEVLQKYTGFSEITPKK